VKTWDKVIYLTFDDGPHPEITPWVLCELQKYNAKATFFCVGDNVKKFPEVFNKTIAEGHAVGNHTMHHVKGWQLSDEAYIENIREASGLIPSQLFRPPYGRIKPRQLKKISSDYRVIMWSKLSRDYDSGLNLKESLTAMKEVKAGDIIVFHDSEKAFPQLKHLLPQLLAYYKENGYMMEVLSR
jgi:peptidoglycan/xylan/chitin deacetylase (PgdA/CDA1 family)